MSGDSAANDIVGTVLLVAIAVALGSVLAVVVSTTITRPTVSPASVAVQAADPGDAKLVLLLRNGEPIPLGDLRVFLQRGTASALNEPSSNWTTPSSTSWRAGDDLTLPLLPVAAAGERLHVTIIRKDANAIVADVTTQTSGAASGLGNAALTANFTPSIIPADALTASLLQVRVVHPQGALAIASVTVDLSNVTRSSGSAASTLDVNDIGKGGDLEGGDGIWSGLIVAPAGTLPGVYNVTVNATDVSGALSGTTVAQLSVGTGPITLTVGERVSLVPAASITQLMLQNWTWDASNPANLGFDHFIVRAQGGGHVWTADVELDYAQGVALAKSLTLTADATQTVYAPRNTSLPLAGLALDLLHPTESLQWKSASGAADPGARYQNSGVTTPAFLAVVWASDKTGAPANTAIESADVVMR